MNCPLCGEWAGRKSATRNARDADGWSVIKRERVCPNGHRFATYECYEYADVEVIFHTRELLTVLAELIRDGDAEGLSLAIARANADFSSDEKAVIE